MKVLAAAILALTLMFSGCASIPHVEHDIPPKIMSWAHQNIWQVGTSAGSGSGFFLDDDTFITACHVVREGTFNTEGNLIVLIRNQRDTRVIQMTLQECWGDEDVAVLTPTEHKHSDKVTTSPTPLALEVPRQGKVVYGVGYPLGMPLTATLGHIQNKLELGPKKISWLVTTNTIMGDSGSPVLALIDGKVQVVGLRSAIRVIPQGMGLRAFLPHLTIMVPAFVIQQVIDEPLHQ